MTSSPHSLPIAIEPAPVIIKPVKSVSPSTSDNFIISAVEQDDMPALVVVGSGTQPVGTSSQAQPVQPADDSKQSKGDVLFQYGTFSAQGRRENMEDEVCIVGDFSVNGAHIKGSFSFFAVYDGHGGRNAALFARDHLQSYLADELSKCATIPEALTSTYLRTDEQFLLSTKDTSGTTAAVALLEHSTRMLFIANAGDSRIVLCRDGIAFAMTVDHKPDNPEEIDRIRKAGGFVIHKRVMGELAISRAIGDPDFKEKDLRLVIADPDVQTVRLNSRDEFLLIACDGLYDVISNEDAVQYVQERLKNNESPDAIAQALVTHAIEKLNTNDNVTVVLVVFKHT